MNPRVCALTTPGDLVEEFKKIGVDWGGIPIMRSKGFTFCVKLSDIPIFSANILKQEMLSLGGDAALHRGALTGRVRRTDCLLMGHLGQYDFLARKLKRQPFGLSRLGGLILKAIGNFWTRKFFLTLTANA